MAALVGVPAFGAVTAWEKFETSAEVQTLVLAAFALVWIPAVMAKCVFGRKSHALRRATLGRLAVRAWIAGMLLLAALVPYFHSQERRWIRRDCLLNADALSSTPFRYESKVTAILRGELREMLEHGGDPR